ncbi:MAG: dephospho-CoA kinase [Candidatus Neomarinimicrobiota bacterium]|nr:MAG: dephospho-CoA kinase [Candidatus Neomarinimicrobiota bacterium]
MVTVGVTGGLGAGKSTACQFLKEKGAYIFNADEVAKDILQENTDVQEKITEAFGPGIVKDGKVDTQKLAKVAFLSEENQTLLNNIIHPLVIEEFEKKFEELKDKEGLLVVDAPLIFESGFDTHLDHTVVIYTTFKHRMERSLRRGNISRDEVLRRMELQMPEEEKRELASYVIENNGSIEELKKRIYELYDELTGTS